MDDAARKTMNRRDFLKGAVALGAALGAAPILCGAEAARPRAAAQNASPANSLENGALPRRTLGRGDAAFEVSALGFGCMGLNYHRGAHPDKKAAIRLVREAAERGVTLFDTAESYGPHTNELLVGEALNECGDGVFATSKFGHKFVNGRRVMSEEDSSPSNIRKVCEESLRRLDAEAIGIFYQHRADPNTPVEVVAETVKELIREGKVLHFGLCEVNADTIRRAHAVCPVTAVQSEYHLMWRAPEKSVLPVCEELGIGFVPYSPLNRGFLGGDLTEYVRFDASNDNRPSLPRFAPDAIRANLRIVQVLHDFGRTRGITSSQIALAWLLHRSPRIVPIPGTTKLSHLEENLRALDVRFAPDEIAELEAFVSAIPIRGSRYDAVQEAKVQS